VNRTALQDYEQVRARKRAIKTDRHHVDKATSVADGGANIL
jgi:hypothetical protein